MYLWNISGTAQGSHLRTSILYNTYVRLAYGRLTQYSLFIALSKPGCIYTVIIASATCYANICFLFIIIYTQIEEK